jgi:molecular chaperone HtpG
MAKKQFKAESKRLLDLMINSIYTHKEIFLREIVSNASDAIDKMNYKAMADQSVGMTKDKFRIDIAIDKDKRTITVSDNGIGMTKDEMEKNLGVIAHSGTLDFKNSLDKDAAKDAGIIGQFGVGFYSAFMVSDSVTVVSRAYGEEKANIWESSGGDGYTISEGERKDVGTDVIMHLKADTKDEKYSEFLETYRIRELVEKYSDYVRWPIHMMVEGGEWKDTGEKDKDGKPKQEYVSKNEDKVVNSMVPIWQKSKKDATDDACREFYKNKFHDFEDPVSVIRISAEGLVSYKAMLFIPKKAPYDFYTRDFQPGLQLYSNGVMIMDKCADILPYCFRFVRGVVDSPDFTLNLSREVLQHDVQLKSVASNLTKKVAAELTRMKKDEADTYKGFYDCFGRQLKYGIVEDYGANKEMLQDLLMFRSAAKEGMIAFNDYVKEMPADQKKIYYVCADTPEHAKALPQTEPVREKGYDVLLLTDDIDQFVMKTIHAYAEKELCDVTAEDLGLETEEEKKKAEEQDAEHKDLLDFAKTTLGDNVSAVKVSHKLKNHAVLLTTEGDVTLEMERYFKEMPGQDGRTIKATRVLELNPVDPAFAKLEDAFKNDKDRAAKLVRIMYAQGCIIAGEPVDDTVGYSDMVFSLF